MPDYTIFTQDDWKNHFVPAEMEKMLRVMELRSRTPGGLDFFYQLPCSWKEGHGIVRRPIVNGQCDLHTFPSKDAILRWSSEFGVPLPPVYLTFTCAFFVVGRARIHRRSKEWWGRMREWLMRGETPDCSNPKAGYALEHMWLPIFTFF